MSSEQPNDRREDALAIVRALVDAGHVAYFAGGCVRDALLGQQPKDYDVATSATPDAVRRLFRRAQGVGQAFGVVLVRIGSSQIEVATFRADGNYSDGRRPDEVRFSDEIDDAKRRDFTINGLFFDPLADRVIDHVGGQADLAARVLRAIGDPAARFSEDYLRLLRAVRFAARLGLTIEPATRDAIVANAPKLARIAPERIATELRTMLTAPSRASAAALLDQLGLTDVLLRGLGAHDVPRRSDRLLARLNADASFPIALAAYLVGANALDGSAAHTLATPSVRRIDAELRRSLRLSNDELSAIRTILNVGVLLTSPQMPRVAAIKRYLAQPSADDGRRFATTLVDDSRLCPRAVELERAFSDAASGDVAPPPFVTGDDLQSMGFAPGPAFKVALDAAYDAQLEGTVTSPAEARSLARAKLT